jgi:hypothetical protein
MKKAFGLGMAVLALVGCDEPDQSPQDVRNALLRANVNSAAEIAAINQPSDNSLHLLARVYVADGAEMGEFYEPRPGLLIFSAAGSPRGASKLAQVPLHENDPIAVFQAIAPNSPVPGALLDAVARSKSLGEGRGTPAVTASDSAAGGSISVPSPQPPTGAQPLATGAASTSDVIETRTSALTSGYCGTQYLTDFPCPSGQSYDWCLVDQFGNGFSTWVHNGIQTYYNVCPEVNNVNLHVWQTAGGLWTVPQDTYRWYSSFASYSFWCGGFCTFDQKSAIENAGSSWWNARGHLTW